MNSDISKNLHKTDKSLLDILGEMSKIPVVKDHENKSQSSDLFVPSPNNLDNKNCGNHPHDPRNRIQSNHKTSSKLETFVWGRMFPETSGSPKQAQSENEVKTEAEDVDELTKMTMILQGDSSSKISPQSNMSRHQPTPQPVQPTPAFKEDLEESESHHSYTLLEQREEYTKKAATLQTNIDLLQQRRKELRGDGLRSPSPETKLLLKENTKLRLVHQNKLKNINNLIEMLNGIIGGKTQVTTNETKTEALREIKAARARFNYVFYDPELHWCRVCDEFPATATDYLTHLHSADHRTRLSAAYMEAPWHSVVKEDAFPTHALADTKRMPIKGLQFFVPSTAWYCKLCDTFIGDLHCASAHLKSVTHSKNYSIFVKENPHWESDWLLDRQKAVEENRRAVSPGEADTFNIESRSGKERGRKKKKKHERERQKYLGSPISSDSDIESVKERVTKKRAHSNDRLPDNSNSKKMSLTKRLEPSITDRKLLNDILTTSIKVRKTISPPRAYRDEWEERRSEARHDEHSTRHDEHSTRHDEHSTRHDKHRSSRHNDRHDETRTLRYDRNYEAWETRSSERSRRSSERRSERERSAVRGERERSDVRSERERNEVRPEQSQTGHGSPISYATPVPAPTPTPLLHAAPAIIPAPPAASDDLDMNQVVEMAQQILQQQAMLGVPFGVDPMCIPPPMPGSMGSSLLGPPPGLPIGMPPPLMQMPFVPPFMGGRLPLPPRVPIRNIKRQLNDQPSSTDKVKQYEKTDTLCPPGEDN